MVDKFFCLDNDFWKPRKELFKQLFTIFIGVRCSDLKIRSVKDVIKGIEDYINKDTQFVDVKHWH